MLRVRRRQGHDRVGPVAEELGRDAADAERHQRPERPIVLQIHDHVAAPWRHPLHDGRRVGSQVQRVARPRGDRPGRADGAAPRARPATPPANRDPRAPSGRHRCPRRPQPAPPSRRMRPAGPPSLPDRAGDHPATSANTLSTTARPTATSMPLTSGGASAGRARQRAYRTARANARTARSGDGYDGTDPGAGAESPGAASAAGTPSKPRKVDSTALSSRVDAAARRAIACCSPAVCCNGGTNTAITTSTSSSSIAVRTASPSWSGEVFTPTSTRRVSCRPSLPHASETRTESAVEFPTTATRSPRGSGCEASSTATSNSSPSVSTRMTPDASNRACTLASGTSTDVCCSPVTVEPRPLFTATIGFRRPSRRATRANLRGLPKLSRYSRARSVVSSVCQILHQVVTRHVGAVAGRDEGRHSEPAAGGLAEHGDAQRPGLAEEPRPPVSGEARRERGVQPHCRIGVDHAEAVRAHDAHAVRPRHLDEAALGQPARFPLHRIAPLTEAAAEDHEPVHALCARTVRPRRARTAPAPR